MLNKKDINLNPNIPASLLHSAQLTDIKFNIWNSAKLLISSIHPGFHQNNQTGTFQYAKLSSGIALGNDSSLPDAAPSPMVTAGIVVSFLQSYTQAGAVITSALGFIQTVSGAYSLVKQTQNFITYLNNTDKKQHKATQINNIKSSYQKLNGKKAGVFVTTKFFLSYLPNAEAASINEKNIGEGEKINLNPCGQASTNQGDNIICISSAEEFNQIISNPNSNRRYLQTQDIDGTRLNSIKAQNLRYDGGGNAIVGLKHSLFTQIDENCEITNLVLDSANISTNSSHNPIGALALNMIGGNVSNVHVTNSKIVTLGVISSAGALVGDIQAGSINGSSSINNYIKTYDTFSDAGGLVGRQQPDAPKKIVLTNLVSAKNEIITEGKRTAAGGIIGRVMLSKQETHVIKNITLVENIISSENNESNAAGLVGSFIESEKSFNSSLSLEISDLVFKDNKIKSKQSDASLVTNVPESSVQANFKIRNVKSNSNVINDNQLAQDNLLIYGSNSSVEQEDICYFHSILDNQAHAEPNSSCNSNADTMCLYTSHQQIAENCSVILPKIRPTFTSPSVITISSTKIATSKINLSTTFDNMAFSSRVPDSMTVLFIGIGAVMAAILGYGGYKIYQAYNRAHTDFNISVQKKLSPMDLFFRYSSNEEYNINNLISQITEKITNLPNNYPNPTEVTLRHAVEVHTVEFPPSTIFTENDELMEEKYTAILTSKKVKATDTDILIIKNTQFAYSQINTWRSISEMDFLKAHNTMLEWLIEPAGKYRESQAIVFESNKLKKILHQGAKPEDVNKLMQELFIWLASTTVHPLIKAAIFHYKLELIHPFSDGNGRMGRLWHSLILSEWHPVFKQIPIENVVREFSHYYSHAFLNSTLDNHDLFIKFMLVAIKITLDKMES